MHPSEEYKHSGFSKPAVCVRSFLKPTSLIRDAELPLRIAGLPRRTLLTVLGRWKQRNSGEATHLQLRAGSFKAPTAIAGSTGAFSAGLFLPAFYVCCAIS